MKPFSLVLIPLLAASLPAQPHSIAPRAESASAPLMWQRVTGHINGVFSPRGYFNLLIGLYSLPTLHRAQFNLGASIIVMDFPPGSPAITAAQIQTIEKRAGYRPGAVTIQSIPQASLSEKGAGWTTIKHPHSNNVLARWIQQNF